ncbi:phosphodiesterase [Alteraurantiacibacter aquimixticola]|uniref:Phosphodiesterase n=1 Tax=Alteraurantiacibacter aquimixticola TaxID=2489173 RepID=A0A4T3F3X7_9SPHN|nr:phosphodiesterase [Alteraurantiacibacter aquimixticola]TIX50994.1 phosphodiesterase [Alteraurantiacibacter aquimixticola]
MIIAQLTDIHIGFEPEARPEELNGQRFRATLDRLLKQPNTPDMLICSGDITDRGDEESFRKTAELLAECPFPVHMMVGNHDCREGLLAAFPDTLRGEDGFIHSAVEHQGLLVVQLDTLEPGRHGGAFCTGRRDWLRAQLEAHRDTPTVIFMHHPPVVSGIKWMDPRADEQWILNLAAALEGMSQVQAIHCGHLHRQIVTDFCGIPLSVTPSVAPLVAMDMRPISPDKPDGRPLITTEPPRYALHHWDGERLVSHYETVSDWEVLAFYGPHLQPMIRDMEREKG